MKRNLSHLSLMFPRRLMSSSQTPTQMSFDYAREIKNMYAQQGGAGYKRNGVLKVGTSLAGENIQTLMHYVPPSGQVQILAVSSAGSIYLLEGESWQVKYSGLNPQGKVRWVHFAGKLVFCNGLDAVMSWNGETVEVVCEYIQEQGGNLLYVSENTFSVESDAALYPAGKELRLENAAGDVVEAVVASASQSGNVTTVTVQADVVDSTLTSVALKEYPPKFQHLYAAHDRLWGMGTGPLQANQFSNNADRTFAFYTAGFGDESHWRDETGALQYINIADKMPVSDEVVAMAVKDGLTIFFGRHYTQVWSGYDPTETGDMSWNKTIPLGLVHGDLVAEMPNDIAFFSRYGVRTLTRMLQTEQLDIADIGSEVDTTVAKHMQQLLSSDAAYRKAMAFKHVDQGWFAFKPADETFVFQLSGSATGWSLFDGVFAEISAALNTPDGKLYVAKGGQLYVYDENVYSDDGAAIATKWWTPWVKPNGNGRAWANKYLEVITEQGEAMPLSIKRYKNYNNSSYVESYASTHAMEDYWEDAEWDTAFWDNGAAKPDVVRDHYVADVVSYAVESVSDQGPLTVYGIKLLGINEK